MVRKVSLGHCPGADVCRPRGHLLLQGALRTSGPLFIPLLPWRALAGAHRCAPHPTPPHTHRGTWPFIALGKKSLPPPRRLNPSTVTLIHGGGEKGLHSRFPRTAWHIVLAPRKNLRPGSRSQPRGAPDGAGVGVTKQHLAPDPPSSPTDPGEPDESL